MVIKEEGRIYGKYGQLLELRDGMLRMSLWSPKRIMRLLRQGWRVTNYFSDGVEFDVPTSKRGECLDAIKMYSRVPVNYEIGREFKSRFEAQMRSLVLSGGSLQ